MNTIEKKKKVTFKDTPKIKIISFDNKIQKEKRTHLKSIMKNKTKNRLISSLLYKKIPTQSEYITKYNFKKRPLGIIKNPSVDIKFHRVIIDNIPFISYKIYNNRKKNRMELTVIGRDRVVNNIPYNILKKDDMIKAEYASKVWILKELRKILKQARIN